MKKYDKSKKKREEYVKIDDYFPRRENIDFNYIIPLKKNEIKLSINSNLSKTKKNKLVSSDDNENKEIYEEGILRPIVDSDEIKNSSSRCFSPKFHIGDILLVSIFDIRKDYMIANYTRNIKVFIHREYSGYSIDKDFNFQNYFNIGQFISVAVISTEKSRNNKKIKCSIEPHIVNAGIDKYHLNEGMDLWGQIKLSKNGLKPYFGFELDEESINEEENENENSEEDENSQFSDNSYSHSLVEEEVKKEKIKINNFEFKFSEESQTYLNKRSKNEKDDIIIRPGSYHFFNLKSIEKEKNDKSYKYTLTFDLSELLKTPKYIKNTNKILINNIRPGMLFKITKTQANYVNGAEVLVTQNIFGNIFEDHLIEQSKNILARVIHISHEREKIGLSSKPNIISLGSKETKDKINLIGKEIRLENYEINIHKKLFGESFILNINKKGIIKEEFKAFIHSSQLEKLDNRKKDLSNRNKDKEKADKNLYNEDNVLHCDYYIKEYNFFDDLPFLSPLIKDNDKFEINKEIKSWNDIKIGLKVKGRIVSIHQNFIKVAITPFITGILNKDHLTDNALKIKNLNKYKENSILSLVIFDYNYLTKNLKLTMKPSLEEITTIDNIKIGSQYNFVYSGNNFFMHCGNVIGRLRQFIEIIKFKSFHEGHIYSMIVDKIENNKIYLLDPNPPDTIKMKMIKNEKKNLNNRGIKEIDILKRKNNDQFDYEKDLKIVIDEEDTKKDIIKSNRLNNKSKEEEEEYQEESEYNEENEELEDNDDEVIDDEDNEIDKSDICEEEEINNDQLKTKVKSSNKREKANLKEELNIRKKEKLIYEREKSNYNPDSIDDFEKKILSNPNSSELWIAYAAFILENINFESSKKIFERAIKTIDISLLKDKLNIWVAYLNLENSFGTKECFSKLVQRALEVNDKKLIYKHIIMIYKNSKTFELVYGIYKIATKQFSNDMSLWKGLLDFTFETNEKFCQIKEVMSSAMQVLISKLKKLEFLLFYSNLLYKYDRIEEGKTAFENLIKDNPKRGDIILVYLDKEIIYNKSLSNIRGIFRRFIDKTLKIKVLKPIIQKYIEWENKNGSQNEKQKANEYVRSIISERTKEIEEKEEKEGQNESEEEI